MKNSSNDITLEGISNLLDKKLLGLKGELKQDIKGVQHEVSEVKNDLTEVKHNVSEVSQGLQTVKEEIKKVRKDMNDGFTKVGNDLADLRNVIKDYSDDIESHVERRLDKLEKHVFAN